MQARGHAGEGETGEGGTAEAVGGGAQTAAEAKHMRKEAEAEKARRDDDLEEIMENIEGNLEEDAKLGMSEEEEIPPKEEDN